MALFKPFDISFVRSTKPSTVRYEEIDLSTQLTDQEYPLSGDFIHILDCTGNAEIKLNETTNSPIDARKIKRVKTPFYRLFVSSKGAQPFGKLKLLIGQEASVSFEERRSSFEVIVNKQDWSVASTATDTLGVDIAGYKKIMLFMTADKSGVFRIGYQPISTFDFGTYMEIESIPFINNTTNRSVNRVITNPLGALQFTFTNDDNADSSTVKIIVIGEK